MKKTTLLFLILFCSYFSFSQNGIPDPNFGNGGVIKTYPTTDGPVNSSSAWSGIVQADGKLIVAVLATKTKLARRLANGKIDSSYGVNGYSQAVSMIVITGAMQADGKIVVAGTSNGQRGFALARYNTNGTLDASFGNSGIVITDISPNFHFLNEIAIKPSGKIIACGLANTNNHSQFVLVQYNSSGTVDNTFGNNGIVLGDFLNSFSSSFNALALQPDGRIIGAGASFSSDNGDFAIARFNADGSPDLSFNGTGQVITNFSFTDVIRSLIVGADGKLYAGGQSVDAGGSTHFHIARYTTSGLLDQTFNNGTGFVTTTFGGGVEGLTHLKQQLDGKILAVGHTISDPLGNDNVMLRINLNGTIDNGFGTNGNGQVRADINGGDENCMYVDLQPDGKIIIGGLSNLFTPTTFESRYTGMRFNTNGSPDAGYGTAGFFADLLSYNFLQYNAVFQQADGKVLAVSETTAQGNNKAFLNRFTANGTPDNSFGQNGVFALEDVSGINFFQPDGKLLRLSTGGTGNQHILLFRNNADGSPDAGFGNAGTVITDLGGIESPTAAAFQPDGKIIIGGLARDDNGSDYLVLRYNNNGTIDGSFGVNGFTRMDFKPEESVNSIAVGPDGKIAFGGISITFPPFNDVFRSFSFIGRLNAEGTVDQSFGDQGKKVINRAVTEGFSNLAIQNDNKIVFTAFENSSIPVPYVGRLNVDGSTDMGFGQNGFVDCDGWQLDLQADQKILISGWKYNNLNNTEFVLSRFNSNGTPDLSFANNGKAIHLFAELDNGFFRTHVAGNNFYAAGSGADAQGTNIGMIAKFILNCQPPVITSIDVAPTTLWPPNHKMKDVAVNYTISSGCNLAGTQIIVSSNEAVQSGTSGDMAPDWEIVNDHLIRLRAERLESGNGRIYTIKVIATDVNGNKDTAAATVAVPKSQSQPPVTLLVNASPNPSFSQFNISINSNSNEKIRVRLMSITGRVLKEINNLSAPQTLKIGAELWPGLYFVEVKQSGTTKTLKLLKL